MRRIGLCLAVMLVCAGCLSTEKPYAYVPKDLDECFTQLDKLLKPDQIAEMRSGTEADMEQYHLGLGMWMRNNWGLWGDSRLQTYFNTLGIRHPDVMSGIILTCYWRHLNQKPIGLSEMIEKMAPQDAHCPKCGEILQHLSWGGVTDKGYVFECANCGLPCLCTRRDGKVTVVSFAISRSRAEALAKGYIQTAPVEVQETVMTEGSPKINVPTWHNGNVVWYFRWSDGFPDDEVKAAVDLYLNPESGSLVDLQFKPKKETVQPTGPRDGVPAAHDP